MSGVLSYINFAGNRRKYIVLACIIIIATATVLGIYFFHKYLVNEAEKRIQGVLQEAEALHFYVQREMHPAMYRLKDEGRLPHDFYAPELLSSSYIARNVFKHYNEIRSKDNETLIEYRLASGNPRNMINKADSLETRLIEIFNKDSSINKFTGVIDIDGKKHLYYARPFLEIEDNCLKCHGKETDAPKALRDYYSWESGYNQNKGEIPAIEIIKTPLGSEFDTLSKAIIVILLVSGLIIALIIILTNLAAKNAIIDNQKNEIENNLKELKEAENKLIQSEKMASLGVLTDGIAHEINNPLNFINGAYLGLEDFFNNKAPEHKKEVAVLLDSIDTGLKRSTKVVDGLLRFSSDSDKFIIKCDINVIIDNCLLMLLPRYRDKIEIERNYGNNILCKGNEGKMHQVFLNIIANAIHSIDNKGIISITTKMDNNKALVLIKDNGCGIDKNNISRIIEPFFTTRDPGKGIGLGLAITYNIIEEHNGELEFESEIGKGTLVRIKLPLS